MKHETIQLTFDPLTAKEIERASSLVKEKLSDSAVFCSVALVEPAKSLESSVDRSSGRGSRQLRLNGYEYESSRTDGGFEATVDLCVEEVRLKRIEDGQAPIGFADVVRAIQITKADEGWQEAMRKRGVTEFELIQIDPWPAGGYQHPSIPLGHRAHRAISFVREDAKDNGYARPVHGLIAHVDLTEGKVAHLEDHGVVPLPPESARYSAEHQASLEPSLSPLEIQQSQGPGFRVEENRIEWRNWEFGVSIHPVNGLVLHRLSYRDGDRLRPILHRAALSDMVVPYGDTDPMHVWKHVLDAGEASLGNCVNSLKLGCDCVGEIFYLDHYAIKPDGSARTIERAICVHEEDYGILWKHHDGLSRTTEVRRSRRLVVSSFYTVGNYEYGFYWYLYLDGTIEMEVKLTGIVGVSAVNEGSERPEFAPLVAPNVASPIHQHLFCFRLDFEVDGPTNRVYEVNVEAEPISDENPDGTAFRANPTLLESEVQARRQVNASSSRVWKVVNPNSLNRLGKPVGYKLVPSATAASLATKQSKVAQRAGFAQYNFWATPFDEGRLCAAGDYPNLHPGGDGLARWTEQDRSIVDQDIVVWHTFGSTHLPRPEDWPVMPVEYCGFTLKPDGFFDRNPSINLPPQDHCIDIGADEPSSKANDS
ncbi:MAG: primary-amine oxidase [Gammaproteobacteria bacterium]|nr:primary-amine oxidase [Gammaproteobacteria bacterium]